jgi:hypothetical protein
MMMVPAEGMHTVMTIPLVRFGVVAIPLFTVALMLKRKGKLGDVVGKAVPTARTHLTRPRKCDNRGNVV